MAFSTQDSDEVLSEINVTPLVDVMLVLLVVFIVTAPLLTNAIPINLPKTEAVAPVEQKDPLVVSIDGVASCSSTRTRSSRTCWKATSRRPRTRTPTCVCSCRPMTA